MTLTCPPLPSDSSRSRGRQASIAKRGAASIEFLVTSLIVVTTPGTGVPYTLAASLSRGCAPASSRRLAALPASFPTWRRLRDPIAAGALVVSALRAVGKPPPASFSSGPGCCQPSPPWQRCGSPVMKQKAPSSERPRSGMTCGRPSGRIVANQYVRVCSGFSRRSLATA